MPLVSGRSGRAAARRGDREGKLCKGKLCKPREGSPSGKTSQKEACTHTHRHTHTHMHKGAAKSQAIPDPPSYPTDRRLCSIKCEGPRLGGKEEKHQKGASQTPTSVLTFVHGGRFATRCGGLVGRGDSSLFVRLPVPEACLSFWPSTRNVGFRRRPEFLSHFNWTRGPYMCINTLFPPCLLVPSPPLALAGICHPRMDGGRPPARRTKPFRRRTSSNPPKRPSEKHKHRPQDHELGKQQQKCQ